MTELAIMSIARPLTKKGGGSMRTYIPRAIARSLGIKDQVTILLWHLSGDILTIEVKGRLEDLNKEELLEYISASKRGRYRKE